MGDCQLSVVPRLHLEYSHYFRMETISVLLPTNDAGSARQKLPRLRRMRDFDFPILQRAQFPTFEPACHFSLAELPLCLSIFLKWIFVFPIHT